MQSSKKNLAMEQGSKRFIVMKRGKDIKLISLFLFSLFLMQQL